MAGPLRARHRSAREYPLAQQLATVTAERDRILRERDRILHERDEYKSRAEWLHTQLERLRDEAKTPRERVDPRQIQLVFGPFARALLALAAPSAASAPDADAASSEEGDNGDNEDKNKRKRKTTPHGRRGLPEHLPIETLGLTPSPLPEGAVQISTEVSWRLGYRRGGHYRLRILRPVYVVPKEAAETSTEVKATLLDAMASPLPSATKGCTEKREDVAAQVASKASGAQGAIRADGDGATRGAIPLRRIGDEEPAALASRSLVQAELTDDAKGIGERGLDGCYARAVVAHGVLPRRES